MIIWRILLSLLVLQTLSVAGCRRDSEHAEAPASDVTVVVEADKTRFLKEEVELQARRQELGAQSEHVEQQRAALEQQLATLSEDDKAARERVVAAVREATNAQKQLEARSAAFEAERKRLEQEKNALLERLAKMAKARDASIEQREDAIARRERAVAIRERNVAAKERQVLARFGDLAAMLSSHNKAENAMAQSAKFSASTPPPPPPTARHGREATMARPQSLDTAERPVQPLALGAKTDSKIDSAIDSAESAGPLTQASLAKIVQGRMGSVQPCYESELKRKPQLKGKIEVEFTIGKDGHTHGARIISNKLKSDAVASCVLARVRGWKFPKPQDSMTVTFPFVFAPSGF